MSPTSIPGRDAAPESTIEAMRTSLAARRYTLNESPPQHEVDGIWSIRLRDSECPMLSSSGSGATELAARASAYAEFVKRLDTHAFWAHYHLGATRANRPFVHYPQEQWYVPAAGGKWPAGVLNPELHAFYNPDGHIDAGVLVDLNSGNVGRGICALPFQRVSDGATVYFPLNLVDNLYAGNGTAAASTPLEARNLALSEICKNAIKHRIIAEGLCLPEVPDDVIARLPRIAATIAGLRKAGFGVMLKDASLGGKYPVMNVTLVHARDQGVLSSYGAHPRFETALERAMTGLLQGRALDALAGYPEPSFDITEVNDAANLESHYADSGGYISWNFMGDQADFPFVDWNFSSTAQGDYDWLVHAIHAEGKQIYVAEFSHHGACSCRIVAPGFSEIRPVQDLEWENNSAGNTLRPLLARLPELSEKECTELLATLQTSYLSEERPLWELLGLAAEDGTPWRELCIGELKTLLALAIGNEEAVLEGCHWIYHFSDLDRDRRLVYRCIESMLNVEEVSDYHRALVMLYGEETVRQASALLDRSERFFGLGALGPDFEGSAVHRMLLAAYDKLVA